MINEYVKSVRVDTKIEKLCEGIDIGAQIDDVPLEESVAASLISTLALIQGSIGGAFAGASVGGKLAVLSANIGMLSPLLIIPATLVGGMGILYLGMKYASKRAKSRPNVKSDKVAMSLVDAIQKRDDLLTKAATEGTTDEIKSGIEKVTKEQMRIGNELTNAIDSDAKSGVISDEEFAKLKDVSTAAKAGKLSYLAKK